MCIDRDLFIGESGSLFPYRDILGHSPHFKSKQVAGLDLCCAKEQPSLKMSTTTKLKLNGASPLDAIRVLDECVNEARGGSIKEGIYDRTISLRPIVTAINWRQIRTDELKSTRHGYHDAEEVDPVTLWMTADDWCALGIAPGMLPREGYYMTMNGTRLYEDDYEILRQTELFVNFKPDKMVSAINAVWDIYGSRFDLSGFSRPDNHPYWKIQALQTLTIHITNLMFKTKHTNEDNMRKLMIFGPRNAQDAQWQAMNFYDLTRTLEEANWLAPGDLVQEHLETLVREQLQCESRRSFRSEACKRECTTLFESTARRLREGKWVDPRVFFGTLTCHLTESITDSSYKFEVPGGEDDGTLQHALWAAQPKPGQAAPQARTPTKRKEQEGGNAANSEKILMEVKTTLEAVKKSADYQATQIKKLTSRVNVVEQQAKK